jgi:DNA invertase Pin-like site-specific DNA recombinase
MSNRCAIYSRVNTSDQTTENQIIELKEIADRKGLTIVGIRKIAKDLKVGVSTVYKVMEAA